MCHIFLFQLLFLAEQTITAKILFIEQFYRDRPYYMLWNYKFGWAGCLHNWAIFKVTVIGRGYIENNFQPYKLIRGFASLVRSKMYIKLVCNKREPPLYLQRPRKFHMFFIITAFFFLVMGPFFSYFTTPFVAKPVRPCQWIM